MMGLTSVPAPTEAAAVNCADMLEFEEFLRRLRAVDDKITYELNDAVPTASFARGVDVGARCERLFSQLRDSYEQRRAAIERCLGETQLIANDSRERRAASPDDPKLHSANRAAQHNLRVVQAEVNIEEVVKARTLKAFYERCRSVYKPPDIS